MTASQSCSVIVTIILSRRMPALFTTTSIPPNVSTACRISRSAPAQEEMSSVFATASPPAAVISSATAWAGPADDPVPSREPPRSLTTTLAPCAANVRACARPMPLPAPVITTTRPVHNPSAI